jgi:hypothetical protein
MPELSMQHIQGARNPVDKTEILTNLGVVVAGILGILAGYFTKRKDAPARPDKGDAIVAGLGLEFGNRLQTDQVIAELKRIGNSLAVLADRRQASTEAKLDRILQELDEAEEREREALIKASRPRRGPRTPL